MKMESLQPYNKLFLFSDGLYEIIKQDGEMMSIQEFSDILKKIASEEGDDLEKLVHEIQTIQGKSSFVDDVSILEVSFKYNIPPSLNPPSELKEA